MLVPTPVPIDDAPIEPANITGPFIDTVPVPVLKVPVPVCDKLNPAKMTDADVVFTVYDADVVEFWTTNFVALFVPLSKTSEVVWNCPVVLLAFGWNTKRPVRDTNPSPPMNVRLTPAVTLVF